MFVPSLALNTAPRAAAPATQNRPVGFAKRTLDLMLTLLGFAAIWPIFALIALAVKATSPGPAFFVQTRIGRDGVPFGMIKFRSMFQDAEARRAAIEANGDREGICFKAKDDPRITPLGRILRRLSLDELPQLINVLKGEMSLVGPRPALPKEVLAYPAHALERLAVQPGITGAWQVSGRADLSFDEMIALDIAYARDGRLTTDLSLLLRTVSAVVSGRGAY